MQRLWKLGRVAVLGALILLAVGRGALAQPVPPAISGAVLDPSGAGIPAATVTLRPEHSGLATLTSGAADGTFEIARLNPGRYVVTASAPGFGPASSTINLPSDTPVTLVLAPAAIVEQVTVVSAARQEELRESLNTRVDVVTRTRIEETGGHETVGEVLREIPGVVTRRGSETAGAAGSQIQGIDSRQVLVLVDGQPVVGARGVKRGGTLNLDRQSTARLDRVEVVKGAASALYGSDALGGVINLITREPSAPLDATVSVAAGTLGVISSRVDAGFRRDRTFGIVSVERHQHDGFDLTPGIFDTTGAPYRRYDVLAKLQHRLSSSFSLGGLVTGYNNHLTGRSIGELGEQEDDVRERTLSVNVTGQWVAGPQTMLEARAYVSSYDESSKGRLAEGAPLDPGRLDEDYRKFDVALSHALGSRHMLQAGAEWSRDHYKGINRLRDAEAGHQADTVVAWAQHRWSLTSRVTTTVGTRVDRRSEFETAVSPKAAVNVRVSDGLHARGSFGRGFRAPDLGQLYYRFLSPSNFYQVIGNPDLDPEYADSWQIGGEYTTPQRRARVGVNFFRNDVRDLIESHSLGFIATPQQLAAVLAREGIDPSFRPALGRPLLTYRNVFDVVTSGVEIDSEAALTSRISLAGSYTYLAAHDAESDLYLTGRHRHHGNARLSWEAREAGVRASLRGTFFSSWITTRTITDAGVTDTVAPEFAIWDLFLSQRFRRGLSAYLTVENLADSQDPNTGVLLPSGSPAAIYRPDAGRTLRVGVQWSFAAR